MAFFRYTTLRLLLLLGTGALLWLAGLRGLWLAFVAVLVSGLLSLVLLRRQRDELSRRIVARQEAVSRRLAERTAAEDAADDAARAARAAEAARARSADEAARTRAAREEQDRPRG